MLERLIAALNSYALGEMDKSATTRLDVLIAQVRGDEELRAALTPQTVVQAINSVDLHRPNVWQAISIVIEKLDIQSDNLAATIERHLLHEAQTAQDAYYAIRAFALSGGQADAIFLDRQQRLKREAPALWLDLLLPTLFGDTAGLTSAIKDLLQAGENQLTWIDLRRRLPKLRQAYGTAFNSAAQEIAATLPNKAAAHQWLEAIDRRYGTKLIETSANHIEHRPDKFANTLQCRNMSEFIERRTRTLVPMYQRFNPDHAARLGH
jgi:hypothetical protein